MTLIPTGTLDRWRTRARRGALLKLKSLLEFRDLIKTEGYREEGVLMQAYKEAAEAMLIAAGTLRDDMANIREYPEDKLIYWITNGVSFDHLEKSNQLAEIAHKAPATLLDECIDPGGEAGETLTVRELTALALGEVPQPMKASTYRLTAIFSQLRKFHTDTWSDDKTTRFNTWLDAGQEFLE